MINLEGLSLILGCLALISLALFYMYSIGIIDLDKKKLILRRWKGDPQVEEKHRHDYRWIKDKEERKAWIKECWEIEE